MSFDNPGIAWARLAPDRSRRRPLPNLASRRAWALVLAVTASLLWMALAQADQAGVPAREQPASSSGGLDTDVQSLGQEVVDLNRDLFILEEELLFPANTQVAVFVSMDVGTFFGLDSVRVLVDGKEVANYLYTQREAEALLRGGVQRLWLGNLRAGTHEMTAFFNGTGPHGRDYSRGATMRIEKGPGAKYIELKISDRAAQLQPEFVVKEWE
jgi:hypothetical protein